MKLLFRTLAFLHAGALLYISITTGEINQMHIALGGMWLTASNVIELEEKVEKLELLQKLANKEKEREI